MKILTPALAGLLLSCLTLQTYAESTVIQAGRVLDVVTGKLDVRHIEIAAPADEPVADEDDALDEDPEAEGTDELAEVED